jgi:hypothetical protein
VTVTVPGAADQSEVNAFPPLAVSAATAATYTISPIDTAPAADSFHITWTAASGAGSALVFIANFDTAGLGGTPVPVEMYCSATDTGDVLVPTRVAQTWLKALPGSRGIRSYRWETTIQSTAAAQLVVIAQHNGDVLHIPAASRSEPGSGEDVP